MERQWNDLIQPFLSPHSIDWTRVLELAPGHGRNTVRLRATAKEMVLVDVNQHWHALNEGPLPGHERLPTAERPPGAWAVWCVEKWGRFRW